MDLWIYGFMDLWIYGFMDWRRIGIVISIYLYFFEHPFKEFNSLFIILVSNPQKQ